MVSPDDLGHSAGPIVVAPTFCQRHWDLLRQHQASMAVAALRALQFGLEKLASAEGWTPANPHDPSEALGIVGQCWVCHFGVGFLNELDDFIAHPPEWARLGERVRADPPVYAHRPGSITFCLCYSGCGALVACVAPAGPADVPHFGTAAGAHKWWDAKHPSEGA